ncbi:hypothetical protein, partial [Acetobacter tropicalis]|uniref:hypothetical protein n=1 Tax=Acetobacter tropicalis TaxID=104102 RepID=UPI0022323851
MQSTTRTVLVPLNVKDRFLNFRMQALLLECLTPEQTRLPQTTATSCGQRGNLTEGLYIGLDYEKVCFV